jgi:hypothetical protein
MKYESALAERFMALNEKQYLPAMVGKVLALVEAENQASREELKKREEELSRRRAEISINIEEHFSNSNIFDTDTGVAFITSDYRCIQVSGDVVKIFSGVSERHNFYKTDKKWKLVEGPRKAEYVSRYKNLVSNSLAEAM